MFNDSNQTTDESILETDDSLLTTEDNPYNPFEQWDEWYAFDTSHGYNTCAYLARMTRTSNELSEFYQNLDISRAMLKILELNLTGNYKKVTKDSFKSKE